MLLDKRHQGCFSVFWKARIGNTITQALQIVRLARQFGESGECGRPHLLNWIVSEGGQRGYHCLVRKGRKLPDGGEARFDGAVAIRCKGLRRLESCLWIKRRQPGSTRCRQTAPSHRRPIVWRNSR